MPQLAMPIYRAVDLRMGLASIEAIQHIFWNRSFILLIDAPLTPLGVVLFLYIPKVCFGI